MNARGALEHLLPLQPKSDDLSSETGYRDGSAFLRIWHRVRPERWAVVWTPGDRWFSVDTDGGYSTNYFEEDTPDDDVRRLLDDFVDVAVAYVSGDQSPTRGHRLQAPSIAISVGAEVVTLRLSLLRGLKAAISGSD